MKYDPSTEEHVNWRRRVRANMLHGGCAVCPYPTACDQESYCDHNRKPWKTTFADRHAKDSAQ